MTTQKLHDKDGNIIKEELSLKDKVSQTTSNFLLSWKTLPKQNKMSAAYLVLFVLIMPITIWAVGQQLNLFPKAAPITSPPSLENYLSSLSNWQKSKNTGIINNSKKTYSLPNSFEIQHDGNKTKPTYITRVYVKQNGIVRTFIYDDLQTPSQNFIFLSVRSADFQNGLSIGIKPDVSQQNYVYCPTIQTGCMDTGKKRTLGWHEFAIYATPKGSYGGIDGESFSYLFANKINGAVNFTFLNFERISIGIQGPDAGNSVYVDDITVNQMDPPPDDLNLVTKYLKLYLDIYDKNFNVETAIQLGERDKYNTIFPGANFIRRFYQSFGLMAGAHVGYYLRTGDQHSLDRAIEMLSAIDKNYDSWKPDPSEWAQDVVAAHFLVIDAWPIWDKLPSDLQTSIATHVREVANYASDNDLICSDYIGNTCAEDMSWPVGFLNMASLAFPNFPESAHWREKTKLYANYTFSKGDLYNGTTLRNIYDDYMIDNHNFHPHVSYGFFAADALMRQNRFTEKVLGTRDPAFEHNTIQVADKMKEFIDFRNFQFKGSKIVRRGRDLNHDGVPDEIPPTANPFLLTGKDDWGRDALSLIVYRLMKDLYQDNTVNDAETGFKTDDLAKHATEYFYYINQGYLWRYEKSDTNLTEMKLTVGTASEKWWNNGAVAMRFLYYLELFDPNVKLKPITIVTINEIKNPADTLKQFVPHEKNPANFVNTP